MIAGLKSNLTTNVMPVFAELQYFNVSLYFSDIEVYSKCGQYTLTSLLGGDWCASRGGQYNKTFHFSNSCQKLVVEAK